MLQVIEHRVEDECRQIYDSRLGYDIRYAYKGTTSSRESMQFCTGGLRVLHPEAIDDKACCDHVLRDGQE